MTTEQALQLIELIVGDDFCEELDIRAVFHPEALSPENKTAHEKLSLIYRIAHSHTPHSCSEVHDDWRDDAERQFSQMREYGLVENERTPE